MLEWTAEAIFALMEFALETVFGDKPPEPPPEREPLPHLTAAEMEAVRRIRQRRQISEGAAKELVVWARAHVPPPGRT
jgi:hypothetical protein